VKEYDFFSHFIFSSSMRTPSLERIFYYECVTLKSRAIDCPQAFRLEID
jgi:hypothetical protein